MAHEDQPDEDDPFAQLAAMRAQMEARRPRDEKNRFDAWLRIMKLASLRGPLFWLASSPDSGDQIINRFEKVTDRIAIPVLKLPLPAHIRVSSTYLVEQISQFHHDARRIQVAISTELEALAMSDHYDPSDEDTLLPGEKDWVEAWETLLGEHFPASSHGRSTVTFYILPKNPVEDLVSFAPESPRSTNGLLGILKQS